MEAKNAAISSQRLDSFVESKLSQFSKFLRVLAESAEYAEDLQSSPWELAVVLSEAERLGARQHDLRWLIMRGWIEHYPTDEACPSSSPQNSHHCATRCDLRADSQFIITQSGLEAFHRCIESSVPRQSKSATLPMNPHWHSERHELTMSGRVVKRFRWPAANQETILSAFHEEHWPPKIDDPLPQVRTLDPRRRLSDTIKCLNRNQCERLIRFRGDGTGEGVLWDALSTAASCRVSY